MAHRTDFLRSAGGTKAVTTLKDLDRELEEIRQRQPQLGKDELFLLWFILAYVSDDEALALQSLTGKSNDKGIDAVIVEDRGRCVHVVQSKYRAKVNHRSESRNDVTSFARVSRTLVDSDGAEFKAFVKGADAFLAGRLKEARQRVTSRGYRLCLYYVTLGKCSPALQSEATGIVHRAHADADIEVLTGSRLMLLLRDYLDGAAPPIPTLDLPIEKGGGVTVNGVLQRYDKANEIESWVVAMRGDAVAELVEHAGIRLFARNIRGFMGGGTPVNRGMAKTLADAPDKFFYYNNGITIVCDRAEKRSSQGKDVLRVSNPQIINGQQTSRMLALEADRSASASVLVKVIRVSRQANVTLEGFDELVSAIVAGTNWQNAIRPSDLMANDRRQIEIERGFRKQGYAYLRKRQTKAEARRSLGGVRYHQIKMDELAQAVAGCDLDPAIVREGKDNLFNEDLYPLVFPTTDPDYYLARYWLFKEVTAGARRNPRRGYAKWLVLGFVWGRLASVLRGSRGARDFRTMIELTDSRIVPPLGRAVDVAYGAALTFYNANKGSGAATADISTFFKGTRGRNREFQSHWTRRESKRRSAFESYLARIRKAMDEFER